MITFYQYLSATSIVQVDKGREVFLKTIGLRLDISTLKLIRLISKRDLCDLEDAYGVDFSEASLLIRVGIGNLILNKPSKNHMEKISASLKDNKTFHAFLQKIYDSGDEPNE